MLISQDSSLERTILNSYPLIKRYCLSITKNYWDAEDLAHDTVEKLINKYQHLNEENISKSLLYKMASNQWIDYMRRKKRHSESDVTVSADFARLHIDKTLENLDTLLERLTPKQAVAVVLKDVFLYKLSEIASRLNTNEVTIKSLLNRARKKLKETDFVVQDSSDYWEEVNREEFQSLLFAAIKLEEMTAMEELIDVVVEEPAPAPQLHPMNLLAGGNNRFSCYKNIA